MTPEDDIDVPAALLSVASALRDLGNGNAATPMGALEAFGIVFKDGADTVASAIERGCGEVAEAIDGLAAAIDRAGKR